MKKWGEGRDGNRAFSKKLGKRPLLPSGFDAYAIKDNFR